MNKKIITIECPYCGAEYLPAEIIVPNSFFGKPTNIERDFNHKIIAMGKKKKQTAGISQREEQKAKRVIRNLCIGLLVLALLFIALYSLAV